MVRSILIAFLYLTLFPLQSLPAGQSPSKMYRWEDEKGKVHYSDTIPVEASKQERVIYDKARVRKLKVVEKPKTAEELARERRLNELRKEEKRLLAEQMARDRALLRTYRNEEDLQLALKGQLNTVDARIRVLEANIKRQRTLLENTIRQAAEIERNGRKVTKPLIDKIEATRNQIHQLQLKIDHEKGAKEQLESKFVHDLERFRRLLAHYKAGTKAVATTRPDTEPSSTQRIILSVAHCSQDVDCNRAWQLARIYVQTHATTPLFINSNSVIHTQDPRLDNDIALTVARIRSKESKDTLFLDVRCKLSSVGQELCHSNKVREIRAGFTAFINEGIRSSTQ